MAKLSLSDIANLQNENSATATINTNSASIETAVENTLSRDGTAPNQMEADFDMNSNRILNLPTPVNADEPLRLQDLSNFYSTGTVSNIPSGGNQGDVLAKTSGVNYEFDWVSDASLVTAGDNIVVSGTSPVTIATTLTPTFTTVNGLTLTTSTGTVTITDAKTLSVTDDATVSGTNTGDQTITLTGDVSGTGTGSFATTIGATKVTSAMLNADVFSTAHTWSGQQTFVSPVLGTPASGVATNLTGTAAGLTAGNVTTNANLTGDVTSVGNATTIGATKVKSAMLNADVFSTAHSWSGVQTFTAPVLGTPASATLTNATGLPLSGLTTQAAYTLVGNNSGSAAVPTAVDIAALTTKASPAATDYIMLSDQAASGAWKKATVSSVASAGSVSSIAGNTGAFTLGSGLTNVVNDIRVTSGAVINSVIGTYNTCADLTVAIPADDTTPQSTEGTQIISVSITLKSASNKVRWRFQGQASANPADVLMATLFNGGANAIAGVMVNNPGNSTRTMLAFEGEHTPGSVGPLTYTVRAGTSNGATAPMRFNGNSSGRYFNALAQTTLVLEEIQA